MCIVAGNVTCSEGSVTIADSEGLQLVEMCTSEGVWSPVCDTSWTTRDATVVCRELGYQSLGTAIIENLKV